MILVCRQLAELRKETKIISRLIRVMKDEKLFFKMLYY